MSTEHPAPRLPEGIKGGLRIVSNGNPSQTVVQTSEGGYIGPIAKLEILPISADSNEPIMARVTIPVSYLDMTLYEERGGKFGEVVNLIDKVRAPLGKEAAREYTDKLLRVLASERFTIWPPAAADKPGS